MVSTMVSPSMLNSASSDITLLRCVDLLEKQLLDTKYKFQQLIFNNRDLKKSMKDLTEYNDELFDKCYQLDCQLTSLNQYSRRNNLEIQGIPERIKQCDLENHVIETFIKIGIKVKSYDIVAVHRLGKYIDGKCRSVIARFTNRKHVDLANNNYELPRKSIKK